MNKYVNKTSVAIILATMLSTSALGISNQVAKPKSRVQDIWQAVYQHVANNAPTYAAGAVIAYCCVANWIVNRERPAVAAALPAALGVAHQAFNGAGGGVNAFGGVGHLRFDDALPSQVLGAGAAESPNLRVDPSVVVAEEAAGLMEEMPELEPVVQDQVPFVAAEEPAAAEQKAAHAAGDEAVRVEAEDPQDALYIGGHHLKGARARNIKWKYTLTEEEATQPGFIRFEDNRGGGPISIAPGHTQPFVTLAVTRTQADEIIMDHPRAILIIDQESYDFIMARRGIRGFVSITIIGGDGSASITPVDRSAPTGQFRGLIVNNLDQARVGGTYKAIVEHNGPVAPVLIVRATNSEIAAFMTNHPKAVLIIDQKTRDFIGEEEIPGFAQVVTVGNILEFNDNV